jgi:hypothetical protein
MSDDLDTLKAYLERLHEKALAKAVAYPPLPDSYASRMGAAN